MDIVYRIAYVALFCVPSAATNDREGHLSEPHQSYSSTYEEISDHTYSWSSWDEWSDCTGNCSGGISKRNRQCLFGVCRGPSVQYRTCNIEPCPEGTKDIRERQCEIYNNVQYDDDQVYSWIPVSPLPAADECALICKAQGHNLTSRWSPAVLDGTPCRSGSRDMCLNGKCIPIGCNYEFNSTSTLDRCLVCGGDDTTCKVWKKKKQSRLVNKGLEEVVLLPRGSFSVWMVLKGVSTSYPGVKTEDGLEGINQKETVVEGWYTIGGTDVQFGRLKSGKLSIAIPDKLKQSLWVTILRTKSFHVGDVQDKLIYQYTVPVNYWRESSGWSSCTKSCVGGVQERRWRCYDQVADEIVNDDNCRRIRPTSTFKTCNNETPCSPEWKIDPWIHCNRTCGGGVERRRVSCVRASPVGLQYVNQDFCPARDRPIMQRSCNTHPCPRWQNITDWSECSVTCAIGKTSRTVQCLDDDGNEVRGCPPSLKPIERKQCHTGRPCLLQPIDDRDVRIFYQVTPRVSLESSASYAFSLWSPCSVTCGTGIRSRNVTCIMFISHTATSEERPESECRLVYASKPNATEECILHPCQSVTNIIPEVIDATTFATRTESEDEVPHNKLTTLQKSSHNHDNNDGYSSQVQSFPSESSYSVSSDYKSEKPKFSSYADYSLSQYNERYIWEQNGLTECSRSCAGGMQETVVECSDIIENNVVSDSHCINSDPVPKTGNMCNEQPCPAEWRVLSFSECSHTCGSGHQTPLKVLCIQVIDASIDDGITSVPESECEDIPYPESISCSNIDCNAYWVMHEWSPCTEQCGRGTKSRLVSCKQLLGNGEEVDRESRQCVGYPPPEIESCNEMDCPPSWLTGEFSECSVTCGQGQRFRPVRCIQVLANGDIVDSSVCPQQDAPRAIEPCSSRVCFEPKILSNSSIFEQKRPKVRIYLTVGQRATMLTKTTLIVYCPVQGMVKPNVQWLKGYAVIPHNRTMRVRAISGGSLKFVQLSTDDSGVYTCQAGPLSEIFHLTVVPRGREWEEGDYRWRSGEWSQCTLTCGRGLQHRDVHCQHANRQADLTDEMCEEVRKPDDVRKCNRQPCTPHWVAGEWSECSSNCRSVGRGTKTRQIGCRNSSGNYIAESECECVEDIDKPTNVSDCSTDRCIPVWHVTEWSNCSASCKIKRKVQCMYKVSREPVDPEHCAAVSRKPPEVLECDSADCPAAVDECTDQMQSCGLVAKLGFCSDSYFNQVCCASCAT